MKEQGLYKGSAILMASMIITKIIGAVFKIPLTNILGGTGMGYFNSAYGLFLPIYTAVSSGLPTALVRLVAENAAKGRYRDVRKLRRISASVFALLGVLATAVMLLLSKPFSVYIAQNPNCLCAVICLAPSMVFCCLACVERGYYEGMRNMYPTAVSQIAEGIVKTVLGLSLALLVLKVGLNQYETVRTVFGIPAATYDEATAAALPFSVGGAMVGITLSEAAGFLVIFIRNRIFGDGINAEQLQRSPVPHSSAHLCKQLFTIAAPIALGGIIISLSSFIDLSTIIGGLKSAIASSPDYFLSRYSFALDGSLGLSELPNFIYGSYTGMTSTIISFVPMAASMLGKTALPNIACIKESRDKAAIKRSVENVMYISLVLSAPMGFGIFALARPILELLYPMRPDEVQIAALPLAVLGLAAVLGAVSIPLTSILHAVGEEKLTVRLALLEAAMRLAGNILLIRIPQLNIMGAVISGMLSYAVTDIIAVCQLKRKVRVNLRFRRIFALPVFCSVCCGASAAASCKILAGFLPQAAATPLAVIIAAVFYFLVLKITKTVRI